MLECWNQMGGMVDDSSTQSKYHWPFSSSFQICYCYFCFGIVGKLNLNSLDYRDQSVDKFIWLIVILVKSCKELKGYSIGLLANSLIVK